MTQRWWCVAGRKGTKNQIIVWYSCHLSYYSTDASNIYTQPNKQINASLSLVKE